MRFPSVFRNCAVMLLALRLCAAAPGDPRKLALAEAIDLALKNNHALIIGAAKTDEAKSARRKAAADYFPQASNTSTFTRLTNTDVLQFSQGAFGTFPGLGPLPSKNLIVPQGDPDTVLVRTQIVQPVTQLLKIREGERVARADELAALADLEGLREQIALAARQFYYGLLTTQVERNVALEQVRVAEEQVAESETEVRRGETLEVSLTEARTRLLEAKQDELTVRIRHSDVLAQFNNLVGLPQGTQVEAEEQVAGPLDLPAKDECVRLAQASTPEIAAAEETVKKAEAAVRAARFEYVPDVSVFARHDYQDGVAFLFHNYGVVGAEFTYTLFDGGKRRSVIGEREAQRAQAVENLRRLKDDAAANVERALDKMEQNQSLIDVAKQVVDLRAEAARIADVQFTRGVIVSSKKSEASAALAKSRADLVRAELGYVQSQAELEVLIGRLPR
jgi:outer membrane protein TolC